MGFNRIFFTKAIIAIIKRNCLINMVELNKGQKTPRNISISVIAAELAAFGKDKLLYFDMEAI